MTDQRWLNLQLADSSGETLGNRDYKLIFPDDTHVEGQLDEEGRLSVLVSSEHRTISLVLISRILKLELDTLPPAESPEGAQERLNHLNYFVGNVDGQLGKFSQGCLMRFQRDHRLPETGILDPATAEKLRAEHGA